jgi:hypothetical protein
VSAFLHFVDIQSWYQLAAGEPVVLGATSINYTLYVYCVLKLKKITISKLQTTIAIVIG